MKHQNTMRAGVRHPTHRHSTHTNHPTSSSTHASSLPVIPSIIKWPDMLRQLIVSTFTRPLNDKALISYLDKQQWPSGLAHALIRNAKKIPIRFFLVDDSGSMSIKDSKRIIKSKAASIFEDCSRWEELKEVLLFLANLSEIGNIPSEFRLLNGADPVMVGLGEDDDIGESLAFAKEVFNESPAGMTPLCTHIRSVIDAISSIADELNANNQKAAVIIMTDGIATDGDVTEALKPLQSLPVWLVIRLCTDDKTVVDYWNNVDQYLELNIDVLQSFPYEAVQVDRMNNWLIYGEPLHRMREFGISSREIDLIDEVQLGKEQIRAICRLLFTDGNHPEEIPHPDADWDEFIKKVKELSSSQPKTLCGVDRKMKNWVNIRELRAYDDRLQAQQVSLLRLLAPSAPQSKTCSIS